jgi:Flp pilus assembly protein TadG
VKNNPSGRFFLSTSLLKTRDARISKWNFAQSMVEFALAIPVLLIIILVVIEIAHIVILFNTVTMATREGSRYASGMSQTGNNGLAHWQDCQGIRAAVERIGGFLGIAESDILIFYDNGPDTAIAEVCNPSPIAGVTKGGRISVKVTVYYSPLVPVIQISPVPISSLSSHTILTNITVGN